jgi:hypothetical protein
VLTYVVEEFDEPQARALFYTFLARSKLLGDENAIDDGVWKVVYEASIQIVQMDVLCVVSLSPAPCMSVWKVV